MFFYDNGWLRHFVLIVILILEIFKVHDLMDFRKSIEQELKNYQYHNQTVSVVEFHKIIIIQIYLEFGAHFTFAPY